MSERNWTEEAIALVANIVGRDPFSTLEERVAWVHKKLQSINLYPADEKVKYMVRETAARLRLEALLEEARKALKEVDEHACFFDLSDDLWFCRHCALSATTIGTVPHLEDCTITHLRAAFQSIERYQEEHR